MLGVLQRDDARGRAAGRRVTAVDGHGPLQQERGVRRGPGGAGGQRGPAGQARGGRPVEQLLEPLAAARHGEAVARAARAPFKSALSRAAAPARRVRALSVGVGFRATLLSLCPRGTATRSRFVSVLTTSLRG